jgi:hypothetical protein
MKLINCFGASAAVVTFLAANAGAQLAAYNSDDVLVCFRNVATPANDLIVDAGPVSNFTNLPVGGTITINTAQLSYVGTNNVAWCACAAFENYPSSDDAWLTKPRASLGTQTTPFNGGSPNYMKIIAGDIDGGLASDAAYSYPASDLPYNSDSVVVEAEANHTTPGQVTGDCYFSWVESSTLVVTDPGTFRGDAPIPGGVVEQITPASFSTGGKPVRSDFYQLLSRSGTANGTPGTYLGYFEFATNGVLTYTAGPSAVAVTAPTITGFSRVGTTNVITFTTVAGGTYNLIGTNSLAVNSTNWPVIGSSVAGDGSPKSITNVAPDALNFYRVTAH